MRPVIDGKASLQEVETYWLLDHLLDYCEMQDIIADLEIEAREKAQKNNK